MKRFLVLATLCVATSAVAGVNEWSPVGPDGGSGYGGVYFLAQPDTAVVATLQGIYRTTDRGANWTRTFQFSSYGFYQGLAVNPAANLSNQVLMHGDGSSGMWRSLDGGQTWSRDYVLNIGQFSAAAFTRNGAVAWAGTSDGRMFRSADGGATWVERSNGLALQFFQVEQIDVDATDPQQLYVVSNGELWRTVDDGANWARIQGTGTNRYYRIAASRTTHNVLLGIHTIANSTVFRSTDGGDTFTTTGLSFISNVEYAPGVAGRAMAIGGNRRAYVTDNDGATWTPRGLLPPGVPMRIAFDASAPDAVLAGTNAGIAFSPDAGSSWSPRHRGIHEMDFARLVRGASPANYLYAASYDHEFVYRRDPATGEWNGIASSAVNIPMNWQGYGFAEAAGNPRTLYLLKDGTLARSTDDGASWQATAGATDGRSLAVDPVDPQVIYLAGYSMPATKTTDGGDSWTPMVNGLPMWGIEDIVIDPSNTQVLYASLGAYASGGPVQPALYRSIDGGANWAPRDSGLTVPFVWRLVMHPTRPQTLYAGSGDGLWRTTNGGASWSRIYDAGSVFDIAVDPQSPDILYLSSNGNPGSSASARSVDGGATWEPLRTGISGATPNGMWIALVPGQPSTLVHSLASYGLHEMVIAPDVRVSANATALTVGVAQNLAITLENAGLFSATSVALTVDLPATSAAPTVQSVNASCTQAAQALNCSIPILRPGESVPLTLGFTPTAHAEQLRLMTSAYEPDSQAANNTVDIATERRADLRAQLASSADTAQTGTTFTYTLSIANVGPSPAANVSGAVQLPANVTYASATTTGLNCAHAAGVVTCTAAALAVDATGSATITVNAATAGAANATVTVTGEGADPLTTNNTASKSVALSDPPPPPAQPPANPTPPRSGGGGGGSLDYLLLALLALLAGLAQAQALRARRPAGLRRH